MTASSVEVAQRLFELTDGQDWAGREALLTADCDFRAPGGSAVGPEGTTAYSRPFSAAFPGSRHEFTVEATERGALVEGTWTGTHTGDLVTPGGTVPPTGATVELRFAAVLGIRDGRVASLHIYFDMVDFLAQLGLVPAPQAA